MTEHALDAMIYAWLVMKEKEGNKMDNVFMGQITGSCSQISEEDGKRCACIYFHDTESNACSKLSHYNKTYSLVLSDDVIKTNDELLTLRDEVKEWGAECNDWKARYAKANNELFQKGLAYGTLETEYKNEKIAGGILLKDRDALKEKVDTLEAELDSLRAENKRLRQLMTTSMSNLFEGSGITINLTQPNGPESLTLKFDIPELNEAKKKVEDLEKKLKAAKSNETFWRDRKEEEEDYHHYWLHTFDRAVKQAAEKGIHIGVCGSDEEDNVGIVTIYNIKAEELEKRVATLEKTNENLDQKIGAADNALEYWNNTYNDIVIAGKNVGVKIDIKGRKPDGNAGFVYVTNEKALELMVNVSDTKHGYNKKWQAMLNALKAKGVEVIYMGEHDGKPIVDIKVPGWEADKQLVRDFTKQCADLRADKFRLEDERDELKEQCDILRKDGVLKGQQCLKLTADLNALKKEYGRLISELAELKSKTVAEVRYEFRPNCLTIICTMCDGSKQTISMDSSEAIDANSISCGTVPKCESCKNHRYFTNGGHYCYLPDSEYKISGMFRCHSLTEEEAEGPACSDFKARKE